MTRSRAILTATLLVTLAACSDSEPEAAPSPTGAATSAAPSSTTDPDRAACHAVSEGPDTPTWQDAIALAEVANLSAHANDAGIASAGDELAETVVRVQSGELEAGPEGNLALNKALLALADACGARFGDGPW